MDPSAELIFVYNAPDGIGAALVDAVHKVVSPATYPCSLCSITYGAVSMKREWRDWLRALPLTSRFLHRDGFRRAFPALSDLALPVVLIRRGDAAPAVMIDAAMLDTMADVPTLITAIEAALGPLLDARRSRD